MSKQKLNEFATRMLNQACYDGHFNIAMEAIDLGAQPDFMGESGKCSLHFAAMGGHGSICEYLAQSFPQCLAIHDQAGMTPLHLACRNGCQQAAIALCQCGADLNARDDFGRKPHECCRDDETRIAMVQFERQQFTSSWAIAALATALGATRGGLGS